MKMKPIDYLRLNVYGQKILDARKNYPDATLADLYDEITMPKDLRAAHRDNDEIVMQIYRLEDGMTEEDIAVRLLMSYEELKNFLASQ